jgi:hypothetical protein
MIDLRQRSYTKELNGWRRYPFDAMAQTLKELNVVNTRLGGHAITISGVRQLIKDQSPVAFAKLGVVAATTSSPSTNFATQER